MTTDRFPKARTLVCVLAMLVLGSLASASGAIAAPAPEAAPSVSSDKADYAPGELVTLAGASWGAGEVVHIRVNDDAGSSWSRDVDVTADDAGVIADSFNLPEWFVAEYSVTATGAAGAVATTSFTDGNVKVAVVGLTGANTAGITQTLYAGAGCTGTVSSGPTTVQVPPTDTAGVGSSQSLRLDAAATATGGQGFLNWSKPAGSNVVFTTIAGTNNRSICIAGFQSGSEDITATYAANSAPTVTAANASVTVNEGQPAANTGNYADTNPGDNVTITASRGTVTKTGTNSGTWSWSFATTDGPDQTGPVTITANDGNGATAATTFTLNVNNVAPTVTLAAANPLSVNEGSTQQTYSYTISDPGVDTVSSVTTSCGANGAKVAASDTNTDTTGSFRCTFADGPSTSVVSASATDSDGATGNLATQSVTVNNVAPTVTLTGAAMADEGQTKTYSFTVTDPGQDTFVVDAGFPDCDAGATNNGTFVAGSLSVTASGGSFQCFFADGPSSANVKIQVRDSDGASDAASQSVQVVVVANVAPTVTAAANQTVNEGASTSLNLGSFSDPGPDSPWAVDVDWGDGSTHATFNMTLTGTLGTLNHTYADGPATQTVSVKVTDKNGGSDTKTFTVTVANVAPTTTLSGANDLSVNEGSAEHSYSYTISDPGVDTVSAVTTSCGANGIKVAASDTNTNTTGSFKCTFPDGPATSTVSASATDSDGATGTPATQTVTVANVAPTVTLAAANSLSVNEGSTQQTYSYAISDPGADTVSAVATSCGANGVKVAGSDTNTNTSGSFKCTFADGPSTSVVSASATDSDGATGNLATQTVTVNNVAPTVTLSGPATANEGDTKTYSFTVVDPGQDTFSVEAGFPDCDAGATNNGTFVAGSLSVNGSGGSFQCFFADGPSSANVKVQVRDSDGASDAASQSVQIVAVANVAPTVTAAANQTANEGASKSFALGSFSDPGPDSPWAVDVDWGDGSSHSTFNMTLTGSLGSLSHTYDDGPATRTVSVKVTDKNGGSDTKTFTVTVANVAPTVTLAPGNDLSVNEGSTEHTYNFTISDPGQDTVTSVATSCGANGTKVAGSDTNTNGTGSFKCTFPDGPASSTVTAQATDSDAAAGNEASQSVAVANVAPTVTLSGANDVSVSEGSVEHVYSYTISDPGVDTVSSVTTSCGANGVKVAGSDTNTDTTGSFRCTFADGPSTSVVSASATDSDGATGNLATQTVTVANVAPSVSLTGPATADEGDTKTYSFLVSDPGNDSFTVDGGFPDCDAGATNNGSYVAGSLAVTAAGGSFKCFFADGPATANVKIKVSDSDGASDSASESVQIVAVANVAPSVTAAADQTAAEGASKSFALGSFSDPGPDSPWAVDVNWGDGSTHTTFTQNVTGTLGTQDHSYADSGSYTVSVKVTDKNNDSDTETFTVAVANVAPTVKLQAGNDVSVNEGATEHSYSYTITDPGADTVSSVHTSCGTDGTKVTGSDSNTDTAGSFRCVFPDGPASSTVSASATDSDGDTGAADSQTVTVANVAPTTTLSGANDLSVNEGTTHTYSYSITDPGQDTVSSVATSCGANATKSDATNTDSGGSFKCSFPDGPNTSVVSASATDSDGDSGAADSQSVAVANVAPTVTLSGANDVSVSEGSVEHVYSYTISDPGVDTVSSVTTSCGANGVKVAGSDTNTDTTGSFRCTFADGPSTSVVSASATDSDGATGNLATQTVTVANVAPSVSLTGPATADEGDTKTYSFLVSDPGNDSFTVDGGFPDCDAGATNNGSYVAGSLAVTAAGGSFKCFFADGPATANVKIKVSDSDGASDSASESVQIVAVANVAPSVTAAADQTAAEGASKSFALGSFSDPGPDSPWAVDVNWGDGSTHTTFTQNVTGTLGTQDHSYADSGSYTVSVKVTDKNNDSDTETFTVAVANVAPTVKLQAGNDVSVNEGATEHSYSYTITDPGADTVSSVHTSCGTDGTKVTGSDSNTDTAGSFRCVFPDGPASSTVSASATDSDGDTGAADSQTVTVANVAPTTTLSGANDLSVNEGTTHTYSYSITDPGQDTVSSVATSCGANATKSDATNTDSGGSFKCSFPDGPNTSVVSASATDSDGDSGAADSQSVAVANVAPTVTLSGANDVSVSEGSVEHVYSYTISDPGVDTVSSVTTSCGANGVKVAGSDTNTDTTGSFRCTFADGPSTSVVSASATDSDGATGNLATQTVTVANVAPSVSLTGPATADEGDTKTYSFLVSDPGNDSFTVDGGFPDCDAGATNNGSYVAGSLAVTAAGGSFKCFFADGPATANVKIKVSDSDGASDSASESVQIVAVANVAPSVTAAADQTAAEGASKSFALGSFSDPGPDSPWAVDVNWGDGSTHTTFTQNVTGTLGTQDHSYADSGSYTVSVKVTDKNNDSDTETFTVAVANVAPTVKLQAGNDVSVNEGATEHSYSYTITDPGADTVSSVHTSCGTDGTKVTGSDSNTDTAGSFRCVFPDGPASSTVSASATDSDGDTGAADSQTVTVANVAPTTTLSGANDLSVNEGTTHTYSYSITDPGQDTVSSVATSCGANATKSDATNTDSGGSFKCSFPDGPNTSVVSASATDSDGDSGAADSQSVAVANVAPTVTLSGANDVSVSEGSVEHVYSYTISDPGVDTVSSVTTSCGANGVKVAGSDTNTDTTGSFRCTFADGPSTSVVSASATDSDGATGNLATQTVTVANVAPSVSLTGPATADEGDTKTYSFLVSDPGNDSFTVDGGFPDCDAGATNNGSYVAGSLAVTAAGGSFKCFFADGPATANVKIKVSDSDGASDSASESVQIVAVANVAPSVTAAADQTAAEGASKSFALGSFSDPGPDSPWAVDVNWGDGSTHTTFTQNVTGTLGTQDHSYADSGSYTVSVKVTDKNNDSDTETFTVAVANVAPTVKLQAGNDVSVNEGATEHSYSYTITDPGADTVSSVHTSCGTDGTKVTGSDSNTDTAGSFRCVFPDGPASSTVSASATDSDGDTGAADSQTVTVANVAPTVTLTGPATADEGSTKTYTFTVTDPGVDTFVASAGYPDCDAATTNNGTLVAGSYTATASGGTFKCFFADGPATATVKMKVADSDGASGTDSESVTVVDVANVAPTVTAPANQAADEGSSKSFDLGSFSDPGPDSPWAVDVNWGDGSAHTTFDATSAGSLGSRSHTYADGPATQTVTVKVTDKNGASNTKTFTVTVANVDPTADLGNNGPKPEGSPVTVSFTNPADPSSGDVTAGFRYSFACTASTALPTTYADAGTATSKDCTFFDNGTYVVKGRIFDRDNGSRTYDTSVTVTNVAPTITSFTGTNSLAGPLAFAPSTFKTDFTDPGTLDKWSAGFTWSSGLPASQTVEPFVTGQKVDHTFAAGCNRTATVKVTDDDGGFDTKSTSVNVGTGTWLPPLADQPVSDKLRNGQVLPVKVKIADCNGVAVTGLAPVIQLVKGDLTSVNDDSAEVITIASVSSADTGTTMRESGGSYMYNLRVNVAAADLNQDFTIIIYPYGTGSPQTMRHVIVATK